MHKKPPLKQSDSSPPQTPGGKKTIHHKKIGYKDGTMHFLVYCFLNVKKNFEL